MNMTPRGSGRQALPPFIRHGWRLLRRGDGLCKDTLISGEERGKRWLLRDPGAAGIVRRRTLTRPSLRHTPLTMLIDTHAHLYLDEFGDDLEAVIDRAREAGVARILLPAIDVSSIHRALRLCERFDGLYAMAALHPTETKEATTTDFDAVASLCDDPRVVAVGETGLDYYWDRSFDDRQQEFLRLHIRLAMDRKLPIVFHNREAFDDLIRIVEEEWGDSKEMDGLRGVFHCFTGTPEEAARIVQAGFAVGIGGIVTFKNAGLAECVRSIPLDRIVLETDAPWLAPAPHRGKRNEPAYVRLVAERLALGKRRVPRGGCRGHEPDGPECFRDWVGWILRGDVSCRFTLKTAKKLPGLCGAFLTIKTQKYTFIAPFLYLFYTKKVLFFS